MDEKRYFKVNIRSKFQDKIGSLVGEIDYLGCYSGWHTLEFENKELGLFTGNEIREVTDRVGIIK